MDGDGGGGGSGRVLDWLTDDVADDDTDDTDDGGGLGDEITRTAPLAMCFGLLSGDGGPVITCGDSGLSILSVLSILSGLSVLSAGPDRMTAWAAFWTTTTCINARRAIDSRNPRFVSYNMLR